MVHNLQTAYLFRKLKNCVDPGMKLPPNSNFSFDGSFVRPYHGKFRGKNQYTTSKCNEQTFRVEDVELTNANQEAIVCQSIVI